MAGMDDLSDEQLKELDSSIDTAYIDARKVEISKADVLMTTFFTGGRRLTSTAQEWRVSKSNKFQELLLLLSNTTEEARSAMPTRTS